MNIFPSFILLIHVTFSNYCYCQFSFTTMLRYIPCPCLYIELSNCNVFVYVTLTFLRYPIVTVFIVTTFATRSVSNIP